MAEVKQETEHKPIALAGIRAMFLVWSHPQGSHRSQFFAETLGMQLRYVYLIRKNGLLAAVFKYPIQAVQTVWVLLKHRPQVVFVQDPPTPAALIVWLCSLILPLEFIIDTHTQRYYLVQFEFLNPLRRFLARRALTNIVTNRHLQAMIVAWEAPAMVMEDPPLPFRKSIEGIPLDGEFNVVWVNTGAPDEPRDIFFETAKQMPHITFYVTSDYSRNADLRQYQHRATDNVRFTGHLPDDEYYQLLKSADAVLTLTTWNYTLQQGACEGMWLGCPVITSDWSVLREYFTDGVLFVDNSVESLTNAVHEMHRNRALYAGKISNTAHLRLFDWDKQVTELMHLLDATFDS